MALAKQAALAKRTRPDNRPHSFRRHHQEVRDRYAIAYRSGVDLVEAYSNLPDHVERLRALLSLPPGARSKRPTRPAKQAQKRLGPDGVAELVAAYAAGGRVKKLATEFGIHRDTVHNILKREGVLRQPGIQQDELPEVVRLYEAGGSMARLAAEFDVSPSTVNRALRKAGTPIRRPSPPRGVGAS